MTLFIIILLLLISYAVIILSLIICYALKKPAESCGVLVVLGCQVRGNRPSKSLKRRLDSACDFLEKHTNVYCIVSGGKGNDELISEAECMYRYLLQKGIPSHRIIKEDNSTNTCENLVYSFNIINSLGLTGDVAIATDFYHHLRANIIAKKHHFKITGAVSSIPPLKVLIFNTSRELVAVSYELLKSIIFNKNCKH